MTLHPPLCRHLAATSLDIGPFFEARHRALCERLVGVGQAVAGHAGPARALAESLGRDHDLYRLLVPEDGPVDVRALVLAREVLGLCNPTADAIFAVQGLGSYPILLAGSQAQKGRYLPRVREGAIIAAFGLTEPEAGSDVASMRTVARRDGDGWLLDGDKTLISNVPIADYHVIFANADPAQGRKGISAFIVERGTPGLALEPQPLSVEHPIGMLHLRACRVPGDALLGPLGGGFKLAMQTLDTFRISVGAAANGMATAALDDAIAHVLGREQFGKPLAEQQIVQAYLAEMATELDAGRLLVARAAHLKDTTAGRASREVAMAKLYATEAAWRVIDKAVQLHGGRGVLRGTRVEALYRDIRPLRIYEGTSEILKLVIARDLIAGR